MLSLLVQPLFIANLMLYQNEVHQDILSLLEQQCISAFYDYKYKAIVSSRTQIELLFHANSDKFFVCVLLNQVRLKLYISPSPFRL